MTALPSAGPTIRGDDDLASQRQRREYRLLESPVVGFPGMTLGDVMQTVLQEIDEHSEAVDVQSLLAEAGHGWQTIETILAYLSVDGTVKVVVPSEGAIDNDD